jgi:hypothetical protein
VVDELGQAAVSDGNDDQDDAEPGARPTRRCDEQDADGSIVMGASD